MTAPAADLAECASEPIRTPGSIQPHGWLASFDAGSGHLVAYSSNWPVLLGGEADAAAIAAALPRVLQPLDRNAALQENAGAVSLGRLPLGEHVLHATAHTHAGLLHIELEPAGDEQGERAPLYTLARHLVPAMQSVPSVQALCALAAEEIKRITGFGRSLVYRFDPDGHGEVLAEALDPGYDRYQGHHFPAADIPAQARELYQRNHFRLIPDAHYTPLPLHFVDPGWQAERFDMSLVGLRSVSPVHLEYMRNMGTQASMSVSIMVRGALWGLISCHDHAARRLPYATRLACEHVGQLLSLQIEAKEDNAQVHEQAVLGQLTLAMVARLADSDATLQRLVDDPGNLLRLGRASGAAVLLNDRCWCVGDTPPPAQLQQLTDWLAVRTHHVFQTDRWSHEWPAAAELAPVAAGLMAVSISQVHRHYVVWFRPEIVQTIDWAGDPHKTEQRTEDGRLHPRRSFATWREQVRGRSLPWSPAEVAAALELRQALIAIVLRRAEEMAEVAGELGRANKELEAFSYTVSHDLRAPMRHIAGYVDLVLDGEGERLSDRARRYLAHVKDASHFAGQLVDALLDFSRMGRSALKHVVVDLNLLVHDLQRELTLQYPQRRLRWDVAPALPVVWGDALLLQVAVRNLMNNAVKYTRQRDEAVISVRALRRPEGEGLEVQDNGIGFQMKYVGKLFGVFQRLHQAEEYEGTGIGLASVRRIIERHGGTVEAQGVHNEGATFRFVLPRRSESGSAAAGTPATFHYDTHIHRAPGRGPSPH